jgi:trehalose synthase
MSFVTYIHAVASGRRPISALAAVVGAERYARLRARGEDFRVRFAGRTIWNINSTAVGGGVAEMLQTLVGYVQDLDIAIRWLVISGDPQFFAVTKSLHNTLHGFPGATPLGPAQAAHYEQVLAANARELLECVRPGDIVLLHDPQTAGLGSWLTRAGVQVVWRCHIGADRPSAASAAGWTFLLPYLRGVDGYVFSRRRYVPPQLPATKTWIIPPSIDPFAPKNHDLAPDAVRAVLHTIGVVDGPDPGGSTSFVQRDGTAGAVVRRASVVADALPAPDDLLVIQVSRWDRLKDMAGVLRGFAEHVAPEVPGHLALIGPSTAHVADDPEGAAVHAECVDLWRRLAPTLRARIMLVSLPLEDVDENAVMVNALQRHASVVTQKSLAEGFGLTVAEAMWKGRPVVGSAVGGIPDQIAHGTGVLIDDPADLESFGAALRQLLADAPARAALGAAAHEHVRTDFVGDLHLLRYAQLFTALSRPQ